MRRNRSLISLALFSLLIVISTRCTSQVDSITDVVSKTDGSSIKYFSKALEVKSVQLDSVANRINTTAELLTMGTLTDDKFGKVKAQLYTEILPQSISSKIPETAIYKSAVLKFYGQYINYIDKAQLDVDQNFKLYELDSIMPTKNFYNDKLRIFIPGDGLKTNPITSFVYNAKKSLKEYTNTSKKVDTVSQIEVPLPMEFGKSLFNARKDKDSNYISSVADFKKKFKGLSVLPDDNNSLFVGFYHAKPSNDFGKESTNGIALTNGISLTDARSKIEITYTISENGSDTDKTYLFYFDNVGGTAYKYTQYVADRKGASFGSVVVPSRLVVNPYKAYDTDFIALEAKVGLSMKLLLDPLREFAKGFKNGRITRAHIKLSNITQLGNPQSLQFYALFTDNTNKRLYQKVSSTTYLRGLQYPTTTATEFKYIYSSTSSLIPYTMSSNKVEDIYLDLTIFMEALVNNVIENEEDIMLFPLVNSFPERFYLSKNDAKLEVFYVEKE